ncbi:Pex24p-domain-containing protein [Sodiomyces alkalinus F11]|uniref:Pex24p-domain-containing protein n=1 Tax=Sodiomyces alkalinus (strain CBS 110278 / VKM F-3762 / F11) TaxID=1314773 RepID=A0A3N2Q7L7_SODAK|nr:Pex24p-domain-containing protein [Sodiomyces alkalinus F11]ROT42658.1 Pex24p-domain-containing protein [Sodiomyces alkalinus F11]
MATAKPSDEAAPSLADDHAANVGSSSAPPTYASFSPVTLSSNTPSRSSRSRPSTILVHQKSPLLLATPPQITRALAYSHPFLLPLNKAVGLLSWTTSDPWESFLVVCAFWAVVIYGDMVIRVAGPIVLVLTLILAMYGRRFSPLSSASQADALSRDADASRSQPNNPGRARAGSEATSTRHHKTLDEMVETLKEFTGRCNVLLGPALELTDFLSTQRTPTSATTRPALIALFVRILFCTPFWYALTLPPMRIITTRRVILLIGTLVLTWHARIMRVARAILWRSASVRRTVALVTGLRFESPVRSSSSSSPSSSSSSSSTTGTAGEGRPDDVVITTSGGTVRKPAQNSESELTRALRRRDHRPGGGGGRDAGVKFTFIIYENQRRWVGLGWTQSLFAYERAAWTDEHNNPVPSKDVFELPEVEEETRMHWRWVEGSTWRVDGVKDDGKEVDYDDEQGKNGWIYYDNTWQNGRRGQDGWGRWTRRRKWYRDAELVEIDEPSAPPTERITTPTQASASASEPNLTTERYSTLSEKMVAPTQSTPNLAIASPEAGGGAASTDEGSTSATGRKGYIEGHHPAPSTSAPSTSSSGAMSFFRMRRGTNQSVATTASSSIAVLAEGADEKGIGKGKGKAREKEKEKEKGKGKGTGKGRDRSASEAALSRDGEEEEDELDALELRVNLELQGQGNGGRWGIGDEARMSLE